MNPDPTIPAHLRISLYMEPVSPPSDPISALRQVLAQNARIPALEAEIAHLRKHNASAELDAMLRVPYSSITGDSEHRPCPFCGGSATVSSAIDASIAPKVERWNATALCRSCEATGPSVTGSTHAEGIANAWAAWDWREGGAR